MKRTIIATILLTFVIGIGIINAISDRSNEPLNTSEYAEEFKDRGGLILEQAGVIGYGFNTQRGAFEFVAELGITNVYPFNVTISDPNITVLVFNVTIHQAPLESMINIASGNVFELKPLQISETDHYQEINKTFHRMDNQFDFKIVVRGIITSTPFEGPLELTWEMRLGFIHYPEGLWTPVNDSDSKELIRLTLERALVDKEIPDYNLIKDKENIVLSTENIRVDLVPEITGVNLLVMEPDQIQRKANREGDFLYLRFSKLELTNKTAVVQLDNVWMKSETSTVMYVSGGGFTIFYYKVSGRWIGAIISTWIS